MGKSFGGRTSYRDVSIDTERSGEGVVSVSCEAVCQELLVRDGDQYTVDLSYLFRLGQGERPRHLLRPMVRYRVDDRDGYRLQLSDIYSGQGFTVASNVAVDTTLFYRLPTESGRW